ncbi:murein hydrolase activator EnvC family protein [Sporomusa acidovorans]|uniref:Murein hydrolase activator EnvC n=1 Tax=Sporomusa acidovorans (strain ATCC 49682 / DSM 3132 / Mol) TaxID=1123286 RepID=A0ABZ3J6L5_SPOA4|nr:M23 family metallopeptidase [Sporomusa acidovorans]OZC23456.1 murein hydrolase activator EnvC precursor [Sporomusa acidovorans DSM 3132]SDF27413.1 Septal ring factor EnvC, activator of murein hydrolases AmiA and AmiB [Sporomusa acidovorans]
MFRKRILSTALVGLLAASVLGTALADDVDDKQRELESVQQQMEMQQNKAAQAQQQVNSVSEQLRVIQGDLDAVTGEYNGILSQIAATEKQIEANTVVLAKVEKNLAERSQILNKRMRDIYKNGQMNYLDVLLGASDFSDFATRADLLKRVVNQDLTLVAQVKAERELVVQKRAELERDKAALNDLKAQAAAKKAQMESRKTEQKKVLDSAVNERDTAEQAYKDLMETSNQIERMLRQIQSSGSGATGSAGGSGAMMWPVSGPITSPFGWRTHPISGSSRFHSGIDIGADYGDAVAAADSGVVVFSGWMGGYGKAVIIDHGNGISTLYGHNSELLVDEGARVQKGQTIARAGSTGYSTGPHVHFEVRENGTPVSPLGYLP